MPRFAQKVEQALYSQEVAEVWIDGGGTMYDRQRHTCCYRKGVKQKREKQ